MFCKRRIFWAAIRKTEWPWHLGCCTLVQFSLSGRKEVCLYLRTWDMLNLRISQTGLLSRVSEKSSLVVDLLAIKPWLSLSAKGEKDIFLDILRRPFKLHTFRKSHISPEKPNKRRRDFLAKAQWTSLEKNNLQSIFLMSGVLNSKGFVEFI